MTWFTGLGGFTGVMVLTNDVGLAGVKGFAGDTGFSWGLTGEIGLTGVAGAEVEKLRGILAGGGGDVRLGRVRLLTNLDSGSVSAFLAERLFTFCGVM